MRGILVLAVCSLLAGCYAYVPVDEAPAPPGARVRVELPPAVSQRVVSRFGPGVSELEGQVVEANDTTLALAVAAFRSRFLGESVANGELVELPRPDVGPVWQRQFSRSRTALLIGALVLGALSLDHGLFGGGAPDGEGKPPIGEQQ